jgi:hypothetical protein
MARIMTSGTSRPSAGRRSADGGGCVREAWLNSIDITLDGYFPRHPKGSAHPIYTSILPPPGFHRDLTFFAIGSRKRDHASKTVKIADKEPPADHQPPH